MLEQAASALLVAERLRRPIAPLSISIANLSELEAYRIAVQVRSMNGSAGVGYKLGYTSAAMRAQMNINEPNYGVLRQGSVVEQGGRVPIEQLIHPLVEPEITFLMARDLEGPGIDHDQAWQAVRTVYASLEIVDTRYESYQFKAADNISDNSSAARFVLGATVDRDRCPDLRSMAVRLAADGQPVDRGEGASAMGDPVLAVVWLANKLAAAGSRIKAGDLVMTGGLTRAYPAHPGSRFSASFDGLGTVDVRF
jgi:2-keto-4-pentenoate hydratase